MKCTDPPLINGRTGRAEFIGCCYSAGSVRAAARTGERHDAHTRVHTHICEIQLGVPFWKCNGSRVGPRCEPPRDSEERDHFARRAPHHSPSIPETVLMRNGHARAADPFERVRANGSAIWGDLRKRGEKLRGSSNERSSLNLPSSTSEL